MSTLIYIMAMYDNSREDPEGSYEYLGHSCQIEILANDLPEPFNEALEIGPDELVIFTADNEDLISGRIPIVIKI